MIKNTIWDSKNTITDRLDVLIMGTTQIILNTCIGFAFFLFAGIFIVRYVAIWALVILAPIAFVFWALSESPISQIKKMWDMWLNNFIQWSIIGIPIAFFLYLAISSFSLMTDIFKQQIEAPEIGGSAPGYLNQIFPYFVVLVFLYLGFIIGLSTSAMGASAVISATKRVQKGAGKKIWHGVKPKLESRWMPALHKEEGKKLPRIHRTGPKEATKWFSTGVEKVPIVRWFLPEGLRKYGQIRPAVEQAQQKTKPYSSDVLAHRILKKADTQIQALADYLEILQRGDAQDLFNKAKKLGFGKTDKEVLENKKFQKIMNRPLDIAAKSGLLSAVVRVDPRLAEIAAVNKIGGYKGLSREKAVAKAVGEARGSHINNWEPEIFDNENVIKAALGKFDRDRWLAINRNVKNGQEKSLKAIDKIFSDWVRANRRESKNMEENWQEFRKHIRDITDGEGYFKALEDTRFKNTGWRRAEYRPTEAEQTASPAVATGLTTQARKKPRGRRGLDRRPSENEPPEPPRGRRGI